MPSKMERLMQQIAEHEQKAKAAKAELEKLRKEQDRQARIAARKERNKALFQAGTVVETAGLLHLTPESLLGGLLTLQETLQQDPSSADRWKDRGTAAWTQKTAKKLD